MMNVTLSDAMKFFKLAACLPIVSNRLKRNTISSPYQAPLASGSKFFRNIIFVSKLIPGNTTNVTRNTENSDDRYVQACFILFLNIPIKI